VSMVASAIRNGTTAVSFPIKTVTIQLDDIGYAGWEVTLRTNPRSSVYDDLVSGDEIRWWAAFGLVVLGWNFVDEDGLPLKGPKEAETQAELDLPIGLLSFVLDRYFEAIRAAAAVPKALNANSGPTSSTSEGQPRNE
jgi:hypothetical protein